MREFQEKKKFKKILYSKGMVITLLILIIFFARATYGVYQKQEESSANTFRAAGELKRLVDRQTLLDSELARLSTDEGIEEEIRAKYGVSKPGEEVLIIVDPDKATTTEILEEESLWGKFKNLFN
ncbi:septum formation initiator family protein [Patescibacteria group bacterium]|nr:septum formation initiator family protein [Patescibacteria group bacterium]